MDGSVGRIQWIASTWCPIICVRPADAEIRTPCQANVELLFPGVVIPIDLSRSRRALKIRAERRGGRRLTMMA